MHADDSAILSLLLQLGAISEEQAAQIKAHALEHKVAIAESLDHCFGGGDADAILR